MKVQVDRATTTASDGSREKRAKSSGRSTNTSVEHSLASRRAVGDPVMWCSSGGGDDDDDVPSSEPRSSSTTDDVWIRVAAESQHLRVPASSPAPLSPAHRRTVITNSANLSGVLYRPVHIGYTHAGSAFDNRVTFTFVLLTSSDFRALCVCRVWCADSSSRFSFRARKPTDTRSRGRHRSPIPTHRLVRAGAGNDDQVPLSSDSSVSTDNCRIL